jgi:hypothetical protein
VATNILLQYKRDGEAYTGIFYVNDSVSLAFGQESFAAMMTYLHRYLVMHAEAVVQLQRTENAKFMPIYMEQNMVELLRTDPAKYIQAHTIPHRTIDLRKGERTSKLAESYAVPAPPVRAGHDTLAAAFGDAIYLSWRNHRVENPLTGRWCFIGELEEAGLTPLEVVTQEGRGWVTVAMEQLLALNDGHDGYYLPREWNEYGLWISKQALRTKYEQYKKDKAQCLAAVTPETP